MNVIDMNIEDLIPYENNPRYNDDAVETVKKSIKEFGFQQPIVVDKNKVIIVGHTRYKAAEQLGLKTVPVIIAANLDPEQIKAYRLVDNKSGEIADWDYEKLDAEIQELINMDFDLFDYELPTMTNTTNDDILDNEEELTDEDMNEFFEPHNPENNTPTKKKVITCPHCGKSIEL